MRMLVALPLFAAVPFQALAEPIGEACRAAEDAAEPDVLSEDVGAVETEMGVGFSY